MFVIDILQNYQLLLHELILQYILTIGFCFNCVSAQKCLIAEMKFEYQSTKLFVAVPRNFMIGLKIFSNNKTQSYNFHILQ